MSINGILHAYNMKTYGLLRKAVEIEEGIRLCEKTRLFPRVPLWQSRGEPEQEDGGAAEGLEEDREISRFGNTGTCACSSQ